MPSGHRRRLVADRRSNLELDGARTGRWSPSLGAWPERGGVRFRVWAPDHAALTVVVETPERLTIDLEKAPDGTFCGITEEIGAGARYRYQWEGGPLFPDPASRFQPEGPHGPSEVVDPWAFRWTDTEWRGVPHEDLVFYELHVGTFTPEGTFEAVAERLEDLVALGVTAIELMPVGDFPGNRNWGYDGVNLFAPARCYGRPDDLRRLVDRAHAHGLAVFLDVVYNHFGPEGNYLGQFSPHYFSTMHKNPWGQGINFDGPHSSMVRAFFIENALHWMHEYHMDGLRLDATHAIQDDRARPFVAELSSRVRESVDGRQVYVFAEDHRNLAHMVKPEGEGGWGLDGVWADDFHHDVRVALAGDNEGYYVDYAGSATTLAKVLNLGWKFTGQYSSFLGESRGTDPSGVPPRRFVFCIQNHDQIGNRALGERLHHQVDLAAYRAASVLLLTAPATPMLFMGQEWAARSPFLFFTDHPEPLGSLVTEGRRKEFEQFSAFSDPKARERIPDPQAVETFRRCVLDRAECAREPHASVFRLYESLLMLRRSEAALRFSHVGSFAAHALTDTTLLIRQDAERGPSLLAVIQMDGSARVDMDGHPAMDGLRGSHCQVVLTTEDRPFAPDACPPEIDLNGPAPIITFRRASAVLLRMWPRVGEAVS